jgi:hypothetical protein
LVLEHQEVPLLQIHPLAAVLAVLGAMVVKQHRTHKQRLATKAAMALEVEAVAAVVAREQLVVMAVMLPAELVAMVVMALLFFGIKKCGH